MSSQSYTRTIIQPINPSTYTLTPNTCDFAVSEPGNTNINLPSPTTQNCPITVLNLSGGNITVKDNLGNTLATLSNNQFATFLGNYLNNAWTIVGSGATGNINSWNTTGNALTATGVLGSTNAQNVQLVYNSVPALTLSNTGITLNTSTNVNGQFLTGLATPTNPTDAANMQYVTTSITNNNTILNGTYVKSAPLIPTLSSNSAGQNGNASGFSVMSPNTGGGPGAYVVFNNTGLNGTANIWAPINASGDTITITFPTGTQYRINGVMLTNRGSGGPSPNLNSFTLTDFSNNVFFTYSTPLTNAATTGLVTFPFSLPTMGVKFTFNFASVPSAGVSFIQLFGSP